MNRSRGIPYVVGQWVRGDRFYGREQLIAEILDGYRNSIWVLGTRRVGKTSLLKQLEHLTAGGDRGFLPIFWDFQGADDPEELGLTFNDALLDSEDRLEAIGIPVADVSSDDMFASIAALRRRLRSLGLCLLLLCDEVEELVSLHRKDPVLLRKLRRALQSQDGVRSVLASSVRLFALAEQRDDTSPFLHGFTPPLYISGLSDDEARSLVRQNQLPESSRPDFSADDVEMIRRRCDNHAYLIQLVCKRFLELGDLDEACEQVATDQMVSYFFSVDFEMLSESERAALRVVSRQSPMNSAAVGQVFRSDSGRGSPLRLENLGFLRRTPDGLIVLSSFFLSRWLQDLAAARTPAFPDESGGEWRGSSDPTASLHTIDGRYALHDRIGDGASGTVFKARDTLLDTWVVVKLLKPEYTAGPESLERVRQEIVLSRDIGHPNILRTYHLGVYEGRIYLTMQWISGRNLAEAIAEEAPLPAGTSLTIATKLASALAAAHGRKILHRDVKPSNILLADDGEPFLADFGLARLIGERGTVSRAGFVGTPHYASPEQAALQPLDERSDIYALGLVLFEMTTGRRPFEADTVPDLLAQHRTTPPPDPRTLNPEIPAALAELTLRCLAKDPAARLASADALATALLGLAQDMT
jgi:hypothetical protein